MDVRALVRAGSEYFWLNDTGCTYFFGDLRDPQSLRRAAKGCSHVIHAAGIEVESSENHHSVTTLQGSIDLVEAAKMREVQHFMMVSCIGAGRGYENPHFDSQRQAEEHLRASGLSHTVLRCAPFVEEFAKLAKDCAAGERPRFWGSKETQISPMARKDAALFSVACLDHPSAKQATLEIGGPETLSMEALVQRALDAAGSDSGPLWSGSTSLVAANLARVAGRRWKHWIQRQALMYGEDHVVDMGALGAELGLPLTPVDKALAESIAAWVPGQDPEDRNEKVVHRQFQATVYAPGEVLWEDLPDGPMRESD